jgi:hypothetical protein
MFEHCVLNFMLYFLQCGLFLSAFSTDPVKQAVRRPAELI